MANTPKTYTLMEAYRYVLRKLKYASENEVEGTTLYYCVLLAYYCTKELAEQGCPLPTQLVAIKSHCERTQFRIFKDGGFVIAKALDRADELKETHNAKLLRNNPVGHRLIALADEYRKICPIG
jgi:hypothetical protein